MKILFFGKNGHWATEKCLDFLSGMNCAVDSYTGTRRDKFPDGPEQFDGDLIISFSSPWIIPENLLTKAKMAAINFHPGPPEYPGIGCTNFALYDDVEEFGVTCHHMANKVDSGQIISVARFPISPEDTVKSLTDRCYQHMHEMFETVMGEAIAKGQLATSKETWKRQPYTRSQLDDLCLIPSNVSEEELKKRIRATRFPGYPEPHVELHGKKFCLQSDD